MTQSRAATRAEVSSAIGVCTAAGAFSGLIEGNISSRGDFTIYRPIIVGEHEAGYAEHVARARVAVRRACAALGFSFGPVMYPGMPGQHTLLCDVDGQVRGQLYGTNAVIFQFGARVPQCCMVEVQS